MSETTEQSKTVAIISYITIIGWIIALVMYNNEQNKSSLAIFHIRQTLGLYLTGVALFIVQSILIFVPILGWLLSLILSLAGIGLFVLWILGLISAANGEEKPLPLVGELYQNLLSGLK